MKRSVVVLILSVLCVLRPWDATAQEAPLWPGANYDPVIPTIKSVLGHDHGEVAETARMRAREITLLSEHHWHGVPPKGFRQTHD